MKIEHTTYNEVRAISPAQQNSSPHQANHLLETTHRIKTFLKSKSKRLHIRSFSTSHATRPHISRPVRQNHKNHPYHQNGSQTSSLGPNAPANRSVSTSLLRILREEQAARNRGNHKIPREAREDRPGSIATSPNSSLAPSIFPLDLETWRQQQRGLGRDFATRTSGTHGSSSPSEMSSATPGGMAFWPGGDVHWGTRFTTPSGGVSVSPSVTTESSGAVTPALSIPGRRGLGKVPKGLAHPHAVPGQKLRHMDGWGGEGGSPKEDFSSKNKPIASAHSHTIDLSSASASSKPEASSGSANISSVQGTPISQARTPESFGRNLSDLEKMRTAIAEGTLERVVRPRENIPKYRDVLGITESDVAQAFAARGRRPLRGHETEQKDSPASSKSRGSGKISKLKEYMDSGVEVVDEYFAAAGKKGAKLPSPFEYLLYPSLKELEAGKGKKKKESGNEGQEDDSDEEFWCVGEGEPGNEQGEKIVEKDTKDEDVSKEDNSHPQAPSQAPALCKLCRKNPIPSTPLPSIPSTWTPHRGLCTTCSQTFLNTSNYEEDLHIEHKPIRPPLLSREDAACVSMREMLLSTPPGMSSSRIEPGVKGEKGGAPRPPLNDTERSYFPPIEELEQRPPVPPKDPPRDKGKGPALQPEGLALPLSVMATRQDSSMSSDAEGDEDGRYAYHNWQLQSARRESKTLQKPII